MLQHIIPTQESKQNPKILDSTDSYLLPVYAPLTPQHSTGGCQRFGPTQIVGPQTRPHQHPRAATHNRKISISTRISCSHSPTTAQPLPLPWLHGADVAGASSQRCTQPTNSPGRRILDRSFFVLAMSPTVMSPGYSVQRALPCPSHPTLTSSRAFFGPASLDASRFFVLLRALAGLRERQMQDIALASLHRNHTVRISSLNQVYVRWNRNSIRITSRLRSDGSRLESARTFVPFLWPQLPLIARTNSAMTNEGL